MESSGENKKRTVIPLWRFYNQTRESGELSSSIISRPTTFKSRYSFDDKLIEYTRLPKTYLTASELLGAVAVFGKSPQEVQSFPEVQEAAYKIHNSTSTLPSFRAFARHLLNVIPPATSPRSPTNLKGIIRTVRTKTAVQKKRLIENPRNPIPWVDLALCYETLGVRSKAKRAIQTALALAPENRFILRSAVRLLVHQKEFDFATSLLRHSARLRHDPWILSSEIALNSLLGRRQVFIKDARRMLESKRFTLFSTSELSSSLATVEYEAGSFKKFRRFLRSSLLQPTENAMAQATWIAHKDQIEIERPNLTQLAQAYEARAWHAASLGKWKDASDFGALWLSNQPFSSRPAIFSSYVASITMRDFNENLAVVNFGLNANTHEFSLLNNGAFCAFHAGKLDLGNRYLSQIDVGSLSDHETVVYNATCGLSAYKAGNFFLGRKFYAIAIDKADRLKLKRLLALARLHFAYQEIEAIANDKVAERGKSVVQIIDPIKDIKQFADVNTLRSVVLDYARRKP